MANDVDTPSLVPHITQSYFRELGSVCDRGVCEALFQLLAEHTESSNKYELSSALISRAISSANNYGQQYISSEEFVINALDTYVQMLQTPS